MKMKYNKGEWSEAYAFVKLLGEGKVHASDENLNIIHERFYTIFKIFQDDIRKFYEIDSNRQIINVIDRNGDIVSQIDSSKFIDIADESLDIIKNSRGSSFEVPILKDFLKELGIINFKGSSAKKEDIKMEILDLDLDIPKTLNFTIKSYLGNKPTLFNASTATNFLFKIENISDEEVEYLNSINKDTDRQWRKKRFGKIFEGYLNKNYNVTFVEEKDKTLYQNLRLIDSSLPKILAFMLFYFYSHDGVASVSDLTKYLTRYNPLELDDSEKGTFYKKKVSEFLEAVTFGMMPGEKWDGTHEISGGLLTVRKDGDIVCHHIYYDNVSLKNFLFKHTKFESPSGSRHGYGDIYKENGEVFFKLNLQVRFK